MCNRVLSVALACIAALVVTPSTSLSQTPNWVRLHTAFVDGNSPTATVSLPEGSPRVRAVRLAALRGSVALARVVVTYSTGQIHFEERALTLKPGERSSVFDERAEARNVESVAFTFQKGAATPQPTEIEIWGLVPPPQAKTRGREPKRYIEMPILYGTTRMRENDRIKNDRRLATFSGELGEDLVLGRAIVTVPTEREPGTIPRPDLSILITRISFRSEDPNRDFTIAGVDVLPKEEFVAEMRKQLAVSKRYKGQAFIFVHGYNVSFDDAIFRTAQIAHDIGFDGPAFTFSWPSRGGTWDYVHDLNTAKGSREGLRAFLEIVAQDPNVTAVNIVAHSMGNDPTIEVLREQAEIVERKGRTIDFKLNELVLAAPDIARNVFERFAARLASLAKGGVTLLASKNDLAMSASKRVSSGLVRAGDVPKEGIVIVPGIESIDVSDASTSFFSMNHSTFADREHLVTDLRYLFERTNDKHPPDVRYKVYRPAGTQPKQWWQYRKN